MVDVVYPLLQAGVELKFSVRSLLANGSNVGKIFIIGDRPAFFNASKYIHIPFQDAKNTPYANVWRKLETIALDDRISEKLLWMNDDFYIQQKFDAAAVPNYSRSMDLAKMKILDKDINVLSPYKKVLKRTRDVLKARGMTTYHFGTHQPVNFERAKILATVNEFRSEMAQGVSFRCCYQNMHHATDRVIRSTVVVKHVDRAPRKWAFASKATADLTTLAAGLSRLFPRKSALEV